MVNTSDSSSNHHSLTTAPPLTAASGDSTSPMFRPQTLPSPWAQVVRGGDAESTIAVPHSMSMPPPPPPPQSLSLVSSSLPSDQPISSDSVEKSNSNTVAVAVADKSSSDANNGNAGRLKKQAWVKPLNGVVSEGGAVMGADSWPALSESTKVSGKLQPESSSSKVAGGGSSLSSSQAPVTSNSPPKQRYINGKSYSYNMPNRQRWMKPGGNNIGSGLAQRSFSSPPPPPPFPVFQLHPGSYGIPNRSPRGHYRNNSWDTRPPPAGSFVPAMNDYRGSSHNGTFGPHPQRDGSYQNNYGNWRDRNHGNYANTRDAHVHQPSMPPQSGLLMPLPPDTAGFIGSQLIRAPFPNHPFQENYYSPTPPLNYLKGMPFVPPPPPPPLPPPQSGLFHPDAESSLNNLILNQINYYFCDKNLLKDDFLKSKMDEYGWVPVTLIAGFPRIKRLTNNIQLIMDSMQPSASVEVMDFKLRRRGEWKTWLPSAKLQTEAVENATN